MPEYQTRHVICGRTDLPDETEARELVAAHRIHNGATSIVIDSIHNNDDNYVEILATITKPDPVMQHTI